MTPAHLRQSAATSVATVDHRGERRSKGGGLAVVGWSVGLPADEENLEIRILLILSPKHSDIWIHSDEQVQNTKVVMFH